MREVTGYKVNESARHGQDPSPRGRQRADEAAPVGEPAAINLLGAIDGALDAPAPFPEFLRPPHGASRGVTALRSDYVLQLQRAHGNRHVARLLAHPPRVPPALHLVRREEPSPHRRAVPAAPERAPQPAANRRGRTELAGAPAIARFVPAGSALAPAGQPGLVGGLANWLGEGAADLGSRFAAFASNPIGALQGGAWLSLPRELKKQLISAILEAAETVIAAVQGKVLAAVPGIGPLWPLLREFLLGFIRRMREVGENRRVDMSDRLAQLMAGGSGTFMLNLVKGLGLGLWDVVKLPVDLVVAVVDGVKFVARLLDKLTAQDLYDGLTLIATAGQALEQGLRQLLNSPAQALKVIDAIWESIAGAVGQIGRGLAQSLIEMIHLPDAKLGEELGRLTAPFIVDAVLTSFTGVGGAVRQAVSRFAQLAAKITPLLRLGRLAGKALGAANEVLRLAKAIVAPLRSGLTKVAQLFAKSGAGPWLTRFGDWLDRLGDAADLVLTGAALHQKGTPDDAAAAGDVKITETADGVPVAHLDSSEKRPPTKQQEAEFVQVAELTASEVFANLGFKDYSAEREGPEFVLYGIASKHTLLKVEATAIGAFVVKRDRLLMSLIHARKSLLGRAASLRAKAKALAASDPTEATKLQQLANKLTGGSGAKRSEAIGTRSGTQAVKDYLRQQGQTTKAAYEGEYRGTLDKVLKLDDGTYAIIEAKGGQSGLELKEVAPGVHARQGSAAYLLYTLEEMKQKGGKHKEIAEILETQWKSGNVRYFLSETPIPKTGVPVDVNLSEFPLGSHADAHVYLRKRRSRFFKPAAGGGTKKKLPKKKGKP